MRKTTSRVSNWVALAVLATASIASMSVHATASSLDAYEPENRVLVIFSPSDSDGRLIAQRAMNVSDVNGLRERDMVIFSVLPDRLIAELGPKPQGIEANIASGLRAQFEIPEDGFFVILIGKDGHEKARIEALLPPAILFEIIDAMPMRQREMDDTE